MEALTTPTQTLIDDTTRWKEEDLLQLVKHFHRLNQDTEQYDRVKEYTLTIPSEVLQQIQADALEVTSFQLRMGIKKYTKINGAVGKNPNKTHFTFAPKLEIKFGSSEKNKTEEVILLEFEPVTEITPRFQSGQVPYEYKRAVTTNWEEIDNTLIDDLFIVRDPADNQVKRVEFFWVDKTGRTFINDVCDLNQPISLYMGVDMNKFHSKSEVSFTPVFGFTKKPQLAEGFRMMGVIETRGDRVFLEYSSPCPSTCPQE